MKIKSVTKCRCNGCGIEEENPVGWVSLVPMFALGTTMTMTIGGHIQSEDYCSGCVETMRFAALAQSANNASSHPPPPSFEISKDAIEWAISEGGQNMTGTEFAALLLGKP